jgi:hypothetical protein
MKKYYALTLGSLLVTGLAAQAPLNDLCTSAAVLDVAVTGGCSALTVQGTTTDATSEAPEPTCDGTGTVQDVWYTFNTTGFNSPFLLSITAGTMTHWGVEVFQGGCDGVLVGCFTASQPAISLPSLVDSTDYTIRIFTNLALGVAGDFSICVSATPTNSVCGITVYDAGGPNGNYAGGLFPYEEVYTYCPDLPTQAVNLSFTQFNTRSGDLVRIYNGPNINSPLLGTFTGNLNTALPGSFQSTDPTGCITLRFNYNSALLSAAGWAANLTCCASPGLSVSPTSNGPVCQGGTLTLGSGATAGTSFVWTGPNGFTSTEQNPSVPGFAVANVGTYSLTTSNGIQGCNSSATPIFVGLVLPPSALTAGISATEICGSGTVDLTAQATTDVVGLQQGFEIFPAAGWGTSGTAVSAATNATYYAEGARSVYLSYDIDASGQYGMTSDLNLALVPNPILKFKHICGLEQGYDYGFVDFSTNGGNSWAPLPASAYQGVNNSNFTGGNNRFSRNSAAIWQSTFTGSGSNPGTSPGTNLWQEETFNLAAYAGSTSFRIRFRLTSDASINYYGWLIDDVRVLGTAVASYAWSSTPAGFVSAAQNPTAVPVSTNTAYTVVASTGQGCSLSQIVSVAVLGGAPAIAGTAAITECAGVPFDLNGSVTGGAAPYTYVWTNAGSVVGAGADLLGLILNTNSTIVLTVTDASGCPQSTSVDVTIAPVPVVTLSSFSNACVNWQPFPLSGGSPAGGTYLVNGVPATNFDPAQGVALYTITYEYTDANGCGGSAQRTLLVDACTGIEDFAVAGIRMFPNPAKDLLYITADVGRYEVRIHDASGRLVKTAGLDVSADRERTISLDGQANGVYSVVIATDDGRQWAGRLVIAR